MKKTKNFFIKIDQYIFNLIDQAKNDPSLSRIFELLQSLNDDEQKIVSQIIIFTCIIIPYLFVVYFWISNGNLRKQNDLKAQILEQMSYLNGNKDTLLSASGMVLTTPALASQGDLENHIVNIASKYQINPTHVKVQSFNPINSSSNYGKIEAEIEFNNFGTNDFSNFMREIIDNEKFKIAAIDLVKNAENELLNGHLRIKHIGRP